MAPKKSGQAAQAEVALLPSLQKCLVNLPASLVQVLDNANTVAQNVVVELSWRPPVTANEGSSKQPSTAQRSIFVGWTGMPSSRRLAPVVGREGLSGSRSGGREQEISVVEVDATLARLIGLGDSQRVNVQLHLDPPEAHTITIDPLTPADWEMIELHATFLETNFLSQVRALPNPAYAASAEGPPQPPHPITLHLTPTSFANVVVSSLTPAPPSMSPFVKVSPAAEVIVAPKTRQRSERASGESRSVTSRRSAGGRSGTSTARHRQDKDSNRGAVFLRGLDRSICSEWFDEDEGTKEHALKVWIDRDLVLHRPLRGVRWVSVSIVKPAGLQEPVDMSTEAQTEKPAAKVVASLEPWDDAPDSQHVALSTTLCQVLGSKDLSGGLVKIEPAPSQAPKPSKASALKDEKSSAKSPSKEGGPRSIKVLPFVISASDKGGLKFGGESRQEKEDAAQRLKKIFGKSSDYDGLLDGPLTDGMLLPLSQADQGWQGGIIKLDPVPSALTEVSKGSAIWVLGSERKLSIEMQAPIARPASAMKSWLPGQALPQDVPTMVGIEPIIDQLMSHLTHSSSVLLTGGLGAGKTCLTYLLAHRLRCDYLFNIIYFPCRTLITGETRASSIKDTLNRLIGAASWCARPSGRSIVILDDLDRLCPVETEFQEVNGENGRSRHVSEAICAITRQHCSPDSGVVLLATAQSKEALNNVVIGGHVVREIVSLKAPNKEGRRKVLEMLVTQGTVPPTTNGVRPDSSRGNGWHDGTSISGSRPGTSSGQPTGFTVDRNVDFLDLAGQTDGYMPGDLLLLVSRARSEALIRSVSNAYSHASSSGALSLGKQDFAAALKGFTPASLRNVTLQTSTTSWSSIGGLHTTRKTLLETLQYPTTYAPIFAHCPLRLRSGLLLYGYPGCGKTLLASAVAHECGLNFISVKGPEILNKYIGASEKSVRDLFERAEAARPCVLFFDEFDAIAPKRGHDSTGVTDRVVNQLLTQMDGAEGLSGVYVLAATSRPDLIDPALLRPGRLDKSIICDMPNYEDRLDILRALATKVRFSEDLNVSGEAGYRLDGRDLREVARRTEGYSGADLQAVVYNAQLEAIHEVLGDADMNGEGMNGMAQMKSKANKQSGGTASAKDVKGVPPFTHFRFDEKEQTNAAVSGSAALAERTKIAVKIANLQTIKRKQREAQAQQNAASFPPRASSLPHSRTSSFHAPDSYDLDSEHSSPLNKDKDRQTDTDGADGTPGSKEPAIQWRHVLKSLESTRASISPEERRRLAGIYREFIVGRNGEMSDGQGGTEIGGRTSLM